MITPPSPPCRNSNPLNNYQNWNNLVFILTVVLSKSNNGLISQLSPLCKNIVLLALSFQKSISKYRDQLNFTLWAKRWFWNERWSQCDPKSKQKTSLSLLRRISTIFPNRINENIYDALIWYIVSALTLIATKFPSLYRI